MEPMVKQHLQIIWDYMHLHMDLHPCDCIVAFGSFNLDVPVRAAQLYQEGYAPRLLFSGGLGRHTDGRWQECEAVRYARIAMEHGVPESAILLEDQSTNTAENLLFTQKVLTAHNLTPREILVVHHPFMERRVFAALQVYWPQVTALVTSPQMSLETCLERCAAFGLEEKIAIDTLVGDFQRISVYAEKGYQAPQVIPPEAEAAFQALVQMGYTSQLVS